MEQQTDHSDLRSLFAIIWRRKWPFFAILVSIPVAVFVFSSLVPKTYEATTLLAVDAVNVDLVSAPSLSTTETEALLYETSEVADVAAEQVPGGGAGGLPGSVTVETVEGASGELTNLLRVVAQGDTPEGAAQAADAYAEAIDIVRSRETLDQINQSLVNLEAQLAETNDPAEKENLDQQVALLQSSRAQARDSVTVVEPAAPPSTPLSPRPLRNTMLAMIVALLLALGAVYVLERLDRRLREANELEPLLGVPLLSEIPATAFPGAPPAPGMVREAFSTLAASLVYFNLERPLSSVLVTSPTQGDGKTTVSTYLAIALARSGQDVILVDQDLRHAQVAVRLGVEPATGLSELLAGQADLASSLVDVRVGEGEEGRLRAIGAGARPPNPAGLLASERMEELLRELESISDIVVIDTTPLLNVSDALPLLDLVSGVVIVARLGVSSRDALRRARQVFETGTASVLGVVATGSAAAGLYGYGTEYYTADYEDPRRAAATTPQAQASSPPVSGNAHPQPVASAEPHRPADAERQRAAAEAERQRADS